MILELEKRAKARTLSTALPRFRQQGATSALALPLPTSLSLSFTHAHTHALAELPQSPVLQGFLNTVFASRSSNIA